MKFTKKYIELWSIVKKWDLKKIKTKNILANWGKWNCQKKFFRTAFLIFEEANVNVIYNSYIQGVSKSN